MLADGLPVAHIRYLLETRIEHVQEAVSKPPDEEKDSDHQHWVDGFAVAP
jgi:hypothetical protein